MKELHMDTEWPKNFSPDVVRPFFGRLSCYTIALEAWRRGLTVTAVDGSFRHVWISDDEGRSIKFVGSRPSMTSKAAVRLAHNKHRTNTALRKAGYPAPQSHLIDSEQSSSEDVIRQARSLGYPVVLKPMTGTKGRGVFTNITDDDELLSYYDHLKHDLQIDKIVMESHERGDEDLRVLVVGDRVAAVCGRIAANIRGDGTHTIEQLIEIKNKARSHNPFLYSGPIRIDNEVLNYIENAGYSLNTVLDDGEGLTLRGKSNGSAGGDSVDLSSDLPARIQQEIVGAVQSIPGLFAAGVDVLVDRSSGDEIKYTIIEVNATPQIGLNMYPIHGVGQDVPRTWIDVCFPKSRPSDAPGEDTLTFSLKEPLDALRTGSAARVELSPIPPRRLPHRKVYTFSSGRGLTPQQQDRLTRKARSEQISGELSKTPRGYMLRAATETADSLERFVRHVAKVISADPDSTEDWAGVVRHSFRLT